MANSTES